MGRSHSCWYALLMLLLAPRTASAIELHWNDGTTALSFTEATRCTLVVQADSLEQRLPSEWRLLWVADSTTDVSPIPLGQPAACIETIAQVSAVDEPATAADSAAHLRTAHFCSDEGEPAATQARYVVDLPAGSAGNLKVVALDPNDSTQVIESNEITFNGGVLGEYAPVVLRASSIHQSLKLQVTAVGVGLSETDALSIVASDSSWNLPLTITSLSDGAVTASASVAALLPACVVSVGTEGGVVSSASLAADEEPALMNPEGCQTMFDEDLRPRPRYSGVRDSAEGLRVRARLRRQHDRPVRAASLLHSAGPPMGVEHRPHREELRPHLDDRFRDLGGPWRDQQARHVVLRGAA